MQQELDAAHPMLSIDIVGVNEVGHESANNLIVSGRSLPWLQDVDANGDQSSDVWNDSWNVTYRDVIILDGDNSVVETFNLTENNLADADDYSALRTMLIDAAMAEQRPWQNPSNSHDVNNDGFVVPLDVLFQINSINEDGPRRLAAPTGTEVPAYYDANGDGWLSSIDALQVINYMDEMHANGEGSPQEETIVVPAPSPPRADGPVVPFVDSQKSVANAIERSVVRETTPAPPVATPHETSVEHEPGTVQADDEFWAGYWSTDTNLLE